MVTIAIHQPNFIPRIKVLQKIACADVWVVLDSVQYAKQEWQNRAKIITHSSIYPSRWLTLPVCLHNSRNTKIFDIRIERHMQQLSRMRSIIVQEFRKAPYHNEVVAYFDEFISNVKTNSLAELSCVSTLIALRRYAVVPQMTWSSSLVVGGSKSKLVSNICRSMGAQVYIADSGAKNYLDVADFEGIQLVWQNWDHQAAALNLTEWRDGAFINLLALRGPDWVRNHLREMHLS